MAKITLEASTGSAYPVLPADSVIVVEVQSIQDKPVKNNSTGETWTKLEFTFQIDNVPAHLGEELKSLEGSRVWGSTSMKFSLHPDNKLRQWVEALLGLELDEGFELDTDNLVGRRARAVIGNYTKKDGTPGHGVESLLPIAGAAPAPANSGISALLSGSDDDAPPF